MPTIQPAELWRESGRYDDYGKEMLRIRDRHEREMLYGPTNEEQVTEIVRASVKSYRDLPKNALPHPVEIPRRGAAALWRDARARVPDEGRLQLRSRRGGRAAFLQQDVRRLSAHLRPHGAEGDPDAGRDRADRRRPQPRIHHPRRHRRERRPCSRDFLEADRTSFDVDELGGAGVAAGRRPLHGPLRRDRRRARCRGGGKIRRQDRQPARHRGRPGLLFRRQVLAADGRGRRRARTASRWRSKWAPTASACRGWSAR